MDDADRTIYCGNLSAKVTEGILYELFLQAAPLQKVKIPTDRKGRQANYAFITFKHTASVPYVLRLLDGIALYQKKIMLKAKNYLSHHVSLHDSSQHQWMVKPINLYELDLDAHNMRSRSNSRLSDTSPSSRKERNFEHNFDRRPDSSQRSRTERYASHKEINYGHNFNKQRDTSPTTRRQRNERNHEHNFDRRMDTLSGNDGNYYHNFDRRLDILPASCSDENYGHNFDRRLGTLSVSRRDRDYDQNFDRRPNTLPASGRYRNYDHNIDDLLDILPASTRDTHYDHDFEREPNTLPRSRKERPYDHKFDRRNDKPYARPIYCNQNNRYDYKSRKNYGDSYYKRN